MVVYHRTTPAAGQAIRLHGFLDGAAGYNTPRQRDGVLLSDHPPQPDERTDAIDVLALELPFEDVDSLRRFEWPDPDHRAPYHEWLIPAQWVNLRAVLLESVSP